MVRIAAITLDTLLELVGGQVIHELGEDCLSGIHPSLLTIGATSRHPAFAPGSAASNFKSKNESYTLSHLICDRYRESLDFSRTLLILDLRSSEPVACNPGLSARRWIPARLRDAGCPNSSGWR